MIVRHAPGKLFIAGEYSVLEPGGAALIAAVNRGVSVTVRRTRDPVSVRVRSDLVPDAVEYDRVRGRLRPRQPSAGFDHVVSALEVVAELLAERGLDTAPMDIRISSELHVSGTKLGLGSSGAVTVATVAATTAFHGCALDIYARFRLALLAAARLDPSGSGGDLAVGTWGGWVEYRSPDRHFLLDLADGLGIDHAIHATDQDGCRVRPLTVPHGLRFLIGWTGRPASSQALVANLRRGGADPSGVAYRQFTRVSDTCTLEAIAAARAGDRSGFLERIRHARTLLARLDAATGLGIFTDRLRELCHSAEVLGGSAKPSGAGGGDCGLAVFDEDARPPIEKLYARWRAAGIEPLPVDISASPKVVAS